MQPASCRPWFTPWRPSGRTSGRPCSCAERRATTGQTNPRGPSRTVGPARGCPIPGAGVAGRAQQGLRSEGQHRVSEGQEGRSERPGDGVGRPRARVTQDAPRVWHGRKARGSGRSRTDDGGFAIRMLSRFRPGTAAIPEKRPLQRPLPQPQTLLSPKWSRLGRACPRRSGQASSRWSRRAAERRAVGISGTHRHINPGVLLRVRRRRFSHGG